MPRALVVADDLTGATDTAHAFAARGYRTKVQVDSGSPPPDATVLAVNTDSRYADGDVAAERVRAAVDPDAPIVYKKVDSTLRGNIVSEIDAAMAAGNVDRALVAPASPAVDRTTACGTHLVDGRPLTDTEHADDPNGPASAHLPTLLSASDHPIRGCGIGAVAGGVDEVRETVADAPAGALVACDATHDRHLAAIAQAGSELDGGMLYVGSAGLAEHVAVPGEPNHEPQRVTGEGGALGIVGSVNDRSLRQLAAVPEEWVIAVNEELLAGPERAGREAGRLAADRLADGEHAIVTAARDRAAVERTLAAGRDAGLDGSEVRGHVRDALAAAACAGFESDPAGLFVTGGDVATAVFDALGVYALTLSGEAIEAGVPVGRLDGGPAAGTPVVTKAGGFGDRETAVNCLRHLDDDND